MGKEKKKKEEYVIIWLRAQNTQDERRRGAKCAHRSSRSRCFFQLDLFFGLPKKKMHIKERSGKSTDGRRFFSLKS